MKQMSSELQSLMRHMHSYATRYNVDLYRSFKENGGKQSSDGQGAMVKTKFTSVLLSAFSRSACIASARSPSTRSARSAARAVRCTMVPRPLPAVSPMFKAHLLTEICVLYGTGPKEKQEVAGKKSKADAYAGRLDHPSIPVHPMPSSNTQDAPPA